MDMRNYLQGHKRKCLYVTAAVLVAALFLYGCQSPMKYIHPTVDLSYITTVGIVPFKNLTQDEHAGSKVEEVVTTDLLRRGLEVIEIGEVRRVLKTEGYGAEPGEVSKSTAENAGKRLGVQAFVLGTVHEYGTPGSGQTYNEVALTLKLLDVETYTILWEATYSKKGTNVMDRLFGLDKKSTSDLAREVVRDMLDTLFGG